MSTELQSVLDSVIQYDW